MEQFSEFDSGFKMQGVLTTEKESLQRTKEWFEKRRGRFTGSRIKDLMSCGRSGAKARWTSQEKLYDFGQTAEKYIYNVGKERLTGITSMDIDSAAMKWGRENEERVVEQLLKDSVITNYTPKDFEHFYPNGGASVDGIATYKGKEVVLEIKSCVSWDGHFARMYEQVDEKHQDFWQFQAEMLAVNLKKTLYIVTMPMQFEKYDTKIVEASEIHQRAMYERCLIADEAILLWSRYDYQTALQLACANHKERFDNAQDIYG